MKRAPLLALVVSLVLAAAVRIRVSAVPLERDEGEYAYAGQLILQGVPPYEAAYNMKFPGTYYAYSLILALFGESSTGIRLGLLLVNGATTVLVFAVGRRLAGGGLAALAAAAFAVLSLDRWIMGVFAHATHFVLLPALGGLHLLMDGGVARHRRLLASGALLGTAILMKQHAVFYVPLAAGWIAWSGRTEQGLPWSRILRACAILLLGAALPLLAIGMLLAAQGALGAFWFWTIRYAAAYVREVPVAMAAGLLAATLQDITSRTLALWLLALVGVPALWIAPWAARARVFTTGLALASFLAICPGFFFRQHYFILLLPAAALLAGFAVLTLYRTAERFGGRRAARAVAGLVVAAAFGSYLVQERAYLLTMSMRELSRSRYGPNPFVEAPEIAARLRADTTQADRIAVLGSEPEIYFHAGRRSATGYVYTYPLMERQPYAQQMQQEMIRQIEAAHPKYVVFVEVDPSWLVGPWSNLGVVEWGNRYTHACFDLVGIADIKSPTETTYVWDEAVRGYEPLSRSVVYTFRRKSEAACRAPS